MRATDASHGHKPLLRGWTHAVSFPLMAIAGAALLVLAHLTLPHRVVMAVYVTALNVLLWRRLYRLAETKFALA